MRKLIKLHTTKTSKINKYRGIYESKDTELRNEDITSVTDLIKLKLITNFLLNKVKTRRPFN